MGYDALLWTTQEGINTKMVMDFLMWVNMEIRIYPFYYTNKVGLTHKLKTTCLFTNEKDDERDSIGVKKYLASQSRKPIGIIGKLIGKLMNKKNAKMNESTIQSLGINENDYVLEIGLGNGKYIKEIIEKFKGTHVYGLDFSEAMVQSAIKRNKAYIEKGRVQIEKGNINKIPYDDKMFDKLITVNTIYFWSDPRKAISEMKRVLKPGGKLAIGFRSNSVMSQWRSEDYGYSLYTPEVDEVESLLKEVGYSSIRIERYKDKSMEYYCVVAKN